MSPIHNGKVKLRAGALDRASTAIFTGGVIAAAGAALFAEEQPRPWILLLTFVASAILARAPHLLAARTLDDLEGGTEAMTGAEVVAFIVVPLGVIAWALSIYLPGRRR